MNDANLTPFTSDQSREKAAENGRKGGIASGKAKREKKTFQMCADMILQRRATGQIADLLDGYGIPKKDQQNIMALNLAMFLKACKGDPKAAELLERWSGMLNGPADTIEDDALSASLREEAARLDKQETT